jgi:hypothetical protein
MQDGSRVGAIGNYVAASSRRRPRHGEGAHCGATTQTDGAARTLDATLALAPAVD